LPWPLRAQTSQDNSVNRAGLTNATVAVTQPPPAAAPAEASDSDGALSAALDKLIPLVGIVMGCSIPIVIVTAVCYFNHRKTKMLHETVRAMVEKGVPIPPELFAKSGGDWQPNCPPGGNPFQTVFPSQPRNDLRTGLILTGLGIGLTIFIGSPGAIVLFLGVAFVFVGIFEKKKSGPDQTAKP